MSAHHRRHRQKGVAIILFSFLLFLTTAVVGLAIDVGTLYMIKARLSSAADAAALAAGRSVNLADTVATANAQATATAIKFFHANFPDTYMATIGSPSVTAAFNTESDTYGNYNGILDITVSSSVVAPTYFMHIFNYSTVNISTTGTASRRGLVMMLLLDVSSSMNTSPAPSACTVMISSARQFIKYFSPYDRVGLVTFNWTADLAYTPSTAFGNGSLDSTIAGLSCGGNTNSTSALEMAYQNIVSQGLPLALNSIVFFTDGSPNGLSATFPLRRSVDTRWGPAATTPAPPVQGTGFSCTTTGAPGKVCVNMPVSCSSNGTITGTITQTSGQDPNGGDTDSIFKPMSTDSAPIIPGGCNQTGTYERQMIAYIPDTDLYGNSTHGVVATGPGPTVTNGRVSRDNWIYQVNLACDANSVCKNLGGLWSSFPAIGTGSNFFPVGTPYAGKFRNDQPNSIVAASMNTAMDEALRIRSDATYHVVINTLYLTGNGGDAIDREFLPVISNIQDIPGLPYQPVSTPSYPNPAFQAHQEHGQYLVTSDKNALPALFAQLASQVLRLSR